MANRRPTKAERKAYAAEMARAFPTTWAIREPAKSEAQLAYEREERRHQSTDDAGLSTQWLDQPASDAGGL